MPVERTPSLTRARARTSPAGSSTHSSPPSSHLGSLPPPFPLLDLTEDIRKSRATNESVEIESPRLEQPPLAELFSNNFDIGSRDLGARKPEPEASAEPVKYPVDVNANNAAQPAMANQQGLPAALQNSEAFARALFVNRPALPEFHGRDHEDPEESLARCMEYFAACQTPNAQCTQTAEAGLKGAAEKWWESYKPIGISWERFQELLRHKFDSAQVKNNLLAQLYSKKQGDKEPVGTFLQLKYLIYQRLRPEEAEATKIVTLVNLLKPSDKKVLRIREPTDFADLLTKALVAEKDEEDEAATHKAKAKKEIVQEDKAKVEPKEPGLLKCWHCPGYHLHKDCEVLNQRRSQENWREAAEAPAAPAKQA